MSIPSLIRTKWLGVCFGTLLLVTSHQLVSYAAGQPRLLTSDPPPIQSDLLQATDAVTTTKGLRGISLKRNATQNAGDEAAAVPTAVPEEEEATPAPTEEAAEEAAPAETTTVAATADEATGAPVGDLADVRSAVVQIEAVGTFVDPAEGLQLDAAGRGSGFIIDPAGIAVTNNHVVTGGGLYKVFLDGEDEPRNAKVLGVSECADLAVIDIQGEDFAYLDWYEGAIRVGLDVYAAGFPLGDPEYTLTRGIISKEKADGQTGWSSLPKVLQHDATINPGNSGGPLVDEEGRIVGVNYAGNSETNQYFAISRDEAVPIIEQLRTGINIDTIGINGEAISDGDQMTGIWVASVKSGSPADRTGIKPGDILITLEGITLAEDGTMGTYCDILRSHSPEDVLAVQVLRFETKEVLEGQINGRELAQSFSFADELTGDASAAGSQSGSAAAGESYGDYQTISDRTNTLSMDVPVEWSDIDDGDWLWREEPVGIRLVATPDLDSVFDSWDTPGVIFNVSTSLAESETPETILDAIDYSESCTNGGREEIPDGFYTGYYDLWTDCGGGPSRAAIVSVMPETKEFIVLFEIFIASEADVDALDHVLDSFVVTLPNTPNAEGSAGGGESIFDLVDVSGLTYDYVFINEPSLSAILPADWEDRSNGDWVNDDDETLGTTLSVSTDIQAFQDTWTTPGLYVRTATDLEEELDIDELLDSTDLSDTCKYDDRYEHSHTIYGVTYTGAYDLYTECDGEDNAFAYLIVQSDSLEQAVFLEFLAVDEADVEAFEVLLQSFYVSDGSTNTETSSEGSDDPEYTLVTDDTETLVVRVPASWEDVSSGDWVVDDEVIGVQIKASTDIEAYNAGWDTPGLFFGASANFAGADTSETLDTLDYADDCGSSERFEYDDNVFAGHYDLWEECGGTESLWVVLAAAPKASPDYLVLINVLLASDSDLPAFEEILKSFNVEWESDGSEEVVPTAEVVTDALNVRMGPGTNYNLFASVSRGDQLLVVGEYDNCSWLNIVTRDEIEGWVSGNSRYVTLNVDCDAIPAVDAPPPPSNSGGNSPRPGAGGASSSQGCYLFQNQLGAELNITFTRKGDGWNSTFKVGRDAEVRQCFDPGDYTYTLDAPPPWGSTNGEMSVSAGDNFLFPITPGD